MNTVLIFYITWVQGVAYQKQISRAQLMGVGLGKHVKILDPLFISATVEANNFKFDIQLGLGEYLAEKQLFDENWQGAGLEEHSKNYGTPPFISATVEASNFKFGMQLRLRSSLPRNNS